MKCLLNWIICIIIPYVLVAMFSVLSLQESIIETYKSAVISDSYIVVMFFYSAIMLIINCVIATQDETDYWFIKKS